MRYGLASCNLTPDHPVYLAGYAARTEPSNGSYLPLLGRVLVLDDGTHRLVWVTADVIGFCEATAPRLTAAVAAACEVPAEWVLLSASHTHCGPVIRPMDSEWYGPDALAGNDDFVIERLTAAAAQATADLQPGSLGYGVGQSTMGINRRGRVNGQTQMVPDPDGPLDREVAVLRVDDATGRPAAAVVSYGCHPTTMGGQLVGPDYIGYLRLAVEQQLGAPMLFAQGCGGDVKPRNLTADGRFASGPLSEVERCGRELAAAALPVLTGRLEPVSGPLTTRREDVWLPFGPLAPRATYEQAAASEDRWLSRWGHNVLAAIDSGTPLPEGHPLTVQILEVGNRFGAVFLGGEVCCGIGIRLKSELSSRYALRMVVAYTGAVHGYQAAREQFAAGGYEVDGWSRYRTIPAPYRADIEERIVQQALDLAGRPA